MEYFYDGEGRRVKKEFGAEVTVYVYNILGQLAVEYGTAANPESGPEYLTADHLGSTRVVTSETGGILSRYDYLPFGEEIAAAIGNRSSVPGYNSPDNLNHKFTGKERDAESGLDFFINRYLSAAQGRFTSIDPKLCGVPFPRHVAQPQSWNTYTYVLNNPLKFVDPDGQDVEIVATFTGEFSEEEKRKIIGAISSYLNGLDVGKVVIRDSRAADTRTLGQKIQDFFKGPPDFAKLTIIDATSRRQLPDKVFARNFAEFRDDSTAFATVVADAVLHEAFAHQLKPSSNPFLQHLNLQGISGSGLLADHSYFVERRGTLYDSRPNTNPDDGIRPLHKEDQSAIEERLKPIHRKYKEE